VEKYHPTKCPDGVISLSVAENPMVEDLLTAAVASDGKGTTIDAINPSFRDFQIYYQPTHGSAPLLDAMSQFLTNKLLNLSNSLDKDGMVVGAGCNAVLENLAFVLASPGDSVMIPVPYYAAFEFDLVARAGLTIAPVTMNSTLSSVERYYPTRDALDQSYETSLKRGNTPKILLLSHPHNPLGICYPPHVVKECIDWARERKVHLISDEIYAGSVHSPCSTGPFVSALELASGHVPSSSGLGLGDYVHFVYALSKDFALSGLRVGVSYSENKHIRLPMQKLNDFCQVSSQTQMLVSEMLTDEEYLDSFLTEARQRVKHRCEVLIGLLEECSVPYLTPSAGLFLWIDFSEFLEDGGTMEARERALYLDMLHEFGLLFTPGMSMRNELPGYFRCVFTSATEEEFGVALERIRIFVNAKRRQK